MHRLQTRRSHCAPIAEESKLADFYDRPLDGAHPTDDRRRHVGGTQASERRRSALLVFSIPVISVAILNGCLLFYLRKREFLPRKGVSGGDAQSEFRFVYVKNARRLIFGIDRPTFSRYNIGTVHRQDRKVTVSVLAIVSCFSITHASFARSALFFFSTTTMPLAAVADARSLRNGHLRVQHDSKRVDYSQRNGCNHQFAARVGKSGQFRAALDVFGSFSARSRRAYGRRRLSTDGNATLAPATLEPAKIKVQKMNKRNDRIINNKRKDGWPATNRRPFTAIGIANFEA